MMLIEQVHIVPVLSDLDLTDADATMPGDSINMKGFHSCCFIVNCQDLGVASCTCKVFSGITDGLLSSALTFNYAWATAAVTGTDADVLLAWTSAAIVTMTHGTYDNFMLIIEIEASAMDLATGGGEEWLTLDFQDPSTGATGNVSAHAILTPRYKGNVHVTALT